MAKNSSFIYDIFDKTLSFSGVFEKVFGSLLGDLVYNNVAKRYKTALKEVYGYRDIDRFFDDELLKQDTIDIMKIIFKYQDRQLLAEVAPQNNIINRTN